MTFNELVVEYLDRGYTFDAACQYAAMDLGD